MKRVQWIDVARGLGIIFVILGHLYMHELNIIIYSFHVPLFFFLSGYTFNAKSNFKDFFRKKVRSLLIPYLLAGIIISCFTLFYGWCIGESNILYTFFYNLKSLIIQCRKWTLWYVAVLFVLCIIYYRISKWRVIYMCICTTMIFITGVLYNQYVKIYLPLNLDIAMMAAPFFVMGILTKKFNVVDLYILNRDYSYLIFGMNLLISITGTLISYNITGERFDFFNSQYGIIPITYLSAMTGIMCIIYISYKIQKYYFIKFIGKNSFVYFAFHQQIFIIVINDFAQKYNIFSNMFSTKISQIGFSFIIAIFILLIMAIFIKCIKKYKYSYILLGH